MNEKRITRWLIKGPSIYCKFVQKLEKGGGKEKVNGMVVYQTVGEIDLLSLPPSSPVIPKSFSL